MAGGKTALSKCVHRSVRPQHISLIPPCLLRQHPAPTPSSTGECECLTQSYFAPPFPKARWQTPSLRFEYQGLQTARQDPELTVESQLSPGNVSPAGISSHTLIGASILLLEIGDLENPV